MKRSPAAMAAASHWANGPKAAATNTAASTKPVAQADRQSGPVSKNKRSLFASPIQFLHALAVPNKYGNNDAVSLKELFAAKELAETYQFNFSVDLELLLSFLPDEFLVHKRKLHLILGSDLLSGYDHEFLAQFNISQTIVKLPRYGSHHTKMMVNLFTDGSLEVVIMSSNLTKVDCVMTQCLWRSGFLTKGTTSAARGKQFQDDLVHYLGKYQNTKISRLSDVLMGYNFDPVKVTLVASAPGTYSLNGPRPYGYGKLYQALRHVDARGCNLLAQVSSIASPVSQKGEDVASLFSHLLCPLLVDRTLLRPGKKACEDHQAKFSYTPWIVFPSATDVAASEVGFGVGRSIHYDYTGSKRNKLQHEQNIKPYLCRWGKDTTPQGHSSKAPGAPCQPPAATGRESNPPHVKYYLCDNGDNFRSLKWVLMGSHNLSKQAWGGGRGFGAWWDIENYEISSYELSVLVTPENEEHSLSPIYTTNFHPSPAVRLPFAVPPTRYGPDDVPWSKTVDFGDLKDTLGQTYHGLNGI